jgi:hypothetical protein
LLIISWLLLGFLGGILSLLCEKSMRITGDDVESSDMAGD